jgi:hypothetical protein
VAHPALLDKAVGKENKGFVYLRQKFPRLIEAKKKKGIFVSLQSNQLFKFQDFSIKLSSTKRRAWKAFENVYRKFLTSEMAHD